MATCLNFVNGTCQPIRDDYLCEFKKIISKGKSLAYKRECKIETSGPHGWKYR